jgi:hypothetical protein
VPESHNPEITFQTAPGGVVGTLFYYFPSDSSFATLDTITTVDANPGSLTITQTPEPSIGLLVLSVVALLGFVTLRLPRAIWASRAFIWKGLAKLPVSTVTVRETIMDGCGFVASWFRRSLSCRYRGASILGLLAAFVCSQPQASQAQASHLCFEDFPLFGEVYQMWVSLGQGSSPLGCQLSQEQETSDYVALDTEAEKDPLLSEPGPARERGLYADFENGQIVWSPDQRMTIAAYYVSGSDQVTVNWNIGSPYHYDQIKVVWTVDGKYDEQNFGSYPKSEIEVERFQMQQVAVGVGGLNPRFI